jgi:hypothetical protein
VVECFLAKEDVEGSNPFSRSTLPYKANYVKMPLSGGIFCFVGNGQLSLVAQTVAFCPALAPL